MDPGPATSAFTPSDSEGPPLSIGALALLRTPASDADRESDVSIKKRKRVRTGCFTCRDRHLKCDEALGQCQNCKKSGKICRRGVRLNFVDTQVAAPPTYIQRPAGSSVTFRDDSRTIASEYVGGFERYPSPDRLSPVESPALQTSTPVQLQGLNPLFRNTKHGPSRHVFLEEPADIALLQMFVNQIGPWMDVADETKHFTRILPFYAPEEPLLHAAFSACAGCHVTQPSNQANERLHRHSIAAQMLSESLRDADHDLALCAAAAVILEVAEVLISFPIQSKDPNQASNSARSLVRGCEWNTRTSGLGGACSWLSILMELFDCLTFQRALVWDPDTWGIDMSFVTQPHLTGSEELWTQRIIWICAKVSDFHFSTVHSTTRSTRGAESHRLNEWELYNEWCDRWVTTIPRSMLPLGQVQSWQTTSQSVFPHVWLLEHSASVAQVLYHITRIMLIETDPLRQDPAGMQQEQQHHAYYVCGIVSNDKASAIPIFSSFFLAVAGAYLVDQKAQEETLAILDQVRGNTGMNTGHVEERLMQKWNWHSRDGHQAPPYTGDPLSIEYNTSNPDHDFLQGGLDPFDHALSSNSHPYLDHHHAFDHHNEATFS
ncbi:hypothetical protein BJX70DRAFT_195251 [Aspergillus crustosus]